MKHKNLLRKLSGRWLLTALLTMVSMNLFAEDFTFEGINYTVISEENKTCETKAFNDVNGHLKLPSNPNGYTLVRLGDFSFGNCRVLNSVTIPESVTSLGYNCFSDCTSLTSVSIPKSVTSLGSSCFNGCTSLTSINIPESVTSLGNYCFKGCTSLTSINIPESVTSLSESCFDGCTSLTSITIPESVTSLGSSCFYGCTSLTSLTIPESVTSLGWWCFYGCTSLTSITIPESVTSLGLGCFSGCTSLASVTIPESVTSMGESCFSGCNLRPLLLEGRIKTINNNAFKGLDGYILCRKSDIDYYRKYTALPIYYVEPFSMHLEPKVSGVQIQLEKNIYGIDRELDEVSLSILDNSSNEPLKTLVPNSDECIFKGLKADTPYTIELSWKNENDEEECYQLSFRTKSIETNLTSSSTQTTISVTSLSVNKDETFEPSEIGIIFEKQKYPFTGEKITFKDLLPEIKYYLRPYVIYNEGKDEYTGNEIAIYTKGWDCSAKATDERSTSVELNASFTEDDAHPDKVWWVFDGNEIEGRKTTIVSLKPETKDKATFNISYRKKVYSYPTEFKTEKLELKTLKPKCVSNSCAIVAAETNIADVEPNVGFEWRKNDAPASLPSTEGYGVVCEGMLEGYIKNLQATSYYNVRPFYKDASGKYYYGEWISFDPSDFSYFEPTIRTYPVQDITENSATVRGYVMPGTDNITRQGFQYWKTAGNKVRGKAPAPSEITTVEATGQIMTITLNDLEAATDYTFRVFAETESGYVYGEEQQFTTEGAASISEINNEEINAKIVGYYNLMGVKSSKPHKGMNIVVYSDGTSRKMIKQ